MWADMKPGFRIAGCNINIVARISFHEIFTRMS